jgi:hypothetical protein
MEAADGVGADAQPTPIGPQFVLEHSAKRLAIFGAVVLGVAWLLSSTANHCRHARHGMLHAALQQTCDNHSISVHHHKRL